MYVYVHMYFDPPCAEREGNVTKICFYAGRAGVSHAAIHNTGLDFANLVGLSQPARFAKRILTHTVLGLANVRYTIPGGFSDLNISK